MDRERLDIAIRAAVGTIVNLLATRDFGVVEAITRGRCMTAEQLASTMARYGRTFVPPPATAWDSIDAAQAPDAERATFHVVFPLWTAEEGESDLTLELQLVELHPGTLDSQIVGLHAL